jgi:hypothetical protein
MPDEEARLKTLFMAVRDNLLTWQHSIDSHNHLCRRIKSIKFLEANSPYVSKKLEKPEVLT